MKEMELYEGNRVTLMACSSCNAHCNDCYIGYTGNRTPEDLYRVAFDLMQDGKHVRIDGAEVLTNLEYLKTLKLVGQEWIMTNGLRIYNDTSVIDLLKECGIDTVYISYHFGIQDVIESVPSHVVDEVICKLKKANFKIYLNCTLTNKNYMNIISFAKQAHEMGAKGIGFNKIFQQGKAKNISNEDLSQHQLLAFYKDLKILRTHYNPTEFYITRGGSLGHDTLTGKDNFRCNAGHNRVMITPDNNVYCCNALCKPGYEIGMYKDGKIFLYNDFTHNESFCLAEVLGYLNEENLEKVNNQDFPKLIKRYCDSKN